MIKHNFLFLQELFVLWYDTHLGFSRKWKQDLTKHGLPDGDKHLKAFEIVELFEQDLTKRGPPDGDKYLKAFEIVESFEPHHEKTK